MENVGWRMFENILFALFLLGYYDSVFIFVLIFNCSSASMYCAFIFWGQNPVSTQLCGQCSIPFVSRCISIHFVLGVGIHLYSILG